MLRKNPFEIYTSSQPKTSFGELDWHESALDSKSGVEGIYDSDRTTPRLMWLWLILCVSFISLSARIVYLQVIKGGEFRALSESNRIRKQTLLAPRGLIKDINGSILAQNTASFNLVAVPFDLPKEGLEEQIQKLSASFNLKPDEVATKLKKVNRASIEPIVITQDLVPEQAILFETKASEFVGFSVQKIPVRQYLDAQIFSHVLGHTGLVSQDDLKSLEKDKYGTVDLTGKGGIELRYEQYLHGTNGQNLVEVDAAGKLLSVLGEKSPVAGQTVVLNIDQGLQKKLYDEFAVKRKNIKGAVVALNPKTGEVKALISLPGFDNNLFAHGIKSDDYKKLLEDKNLPLFNRAIAGVYPPGSTVKPMVGAMALEENIVTENTKIVDRGVLIIPHQYDPKITYPFYGWKRDGLGPVDLKDAIARSSDIYFYTVAGGHPQSPINGLGVQRLSEYYRKFNLGSVTGIDIQGEKPGLVPDPAWKQAYYKDNPTMAKWYLGDTYHIGIGQGDMLSTPLQVAVWTSIIANNGTGFRPQIFHHAEDSQGKIIYESKPEVLVNKFLSDHSLKVVQDGMRQTVLIGSARQLLTLPITSAGKTGTSQFDGSDPNRTHAWFTAYAPFEDPQIVITVLVEAGGEGHAVAVPVVKEGLKWWAENRHRK